MNSNLKANTHTSIKHRINELSKIMAAYDIHIERTFAAIKSLPNCSPL